MKIEGLHEMLDQIQRERGISKAALLEAVEASIVSACRKKYTGMPELMAKIDEEGMVRVYLKKLVSKDIEDADRQMTLKAAKKINKKAKIGDEIEIDAPQEDFGRLAAQTAKQVIIQRIREAEKESAYGEFTGKEGELVTGNVQRKEGRGYLINLGRVETLLMGRELVPGEQLRPRDRVKLYVVKVERTPKGPLVVISRSHPNLVKKLFELEVPELGEGILEVKGLAREPGRRTKIAIQSHDRNVGAVGTCVGHMGSRIQNIIRELGHERVDIIEWSTDPKTFITNSLSPATISAIDLNPEEMSAVVKVPEDQLSLAIGRDGQNVRLAVRLTGWKIDIVGEGGTRTGPAEKVEEAPVEEVKEVVAEAGAPAEGSEEPKPVETAEQAEKGE